MPQDEWHQFDAIEQEKGLLIGVDEEEPASWWQRRPCVVAFLVGLSFSVVVLWGTSWSHRPVITMKSIEFEQFDVQAGIDLRGVATAMASINATVRLVYRNTATFFGVHVESSPVRLFYQQLPIACGTMENFYQRSNSERDITSSAIGRDIPLYGGGFTLRSKNGAPMSRIPINISLRFRARAYVLLYDSICCSTILYVALLSWIQIR